VLIVVPVLPGYGLTCLDQDVVRLESLVDDSDRRDVSNLRALLRWQSVMVVTVIVMSPTTRAGVVMIIIVIITTVCQNSTARAKSGDDQRDRATEHFPASRANLTVALRFRRFARKSGGVFTFVVRASHARFRASTNPISVSGTVRVLYGAG